MDISSVNSDLIRGNVTTIILGSLWSADRYGYDILKEIENKSDGQYSLKQATLYNQLKRLEKQGLISSYDGAPDDTGGGKRRYYSLTSEGRNYLKKEKSEYEYSRTILDKLVSSQEFDFTNPIPFDASELRPYSKRDSDDKPKIVYKDKIVEVEVEKVVEVEKLVEKKVYLDRFGNEISEDDVANLAFQAQNDDEQLKEREEQLRRLEDELREEKEARLLTQERLLTIQQENERAEQERLQAEQERLKAEEEARLLAEEEARRKREEQQKPSQTLEEIFAKLDAKSEYDTKNEDIITHAKSEEYNERPEPQEHTYINAYNREPAQPPRSQATLKDIFRELDEREAAIDEQLAREEELKKQEDLVAASVEDKSFAESQLHSSTSIQDNINVSKGQFATSAVINRPAETFGYENENVNYLEFFGSILQPEDKPEKEEKPQQQPVYEEGDIKTRLYAKGYKIRPYDRGNTSEYYTFNFLQSNRIRRDTFLIILAFFAVEVAIMWLSLATRISYKYFLPILLIGSALCLVPLVVYLSNPTRRIRANFNFRLSILNRTMLFIELTVVCILIGFFGLGASVNDMDLILCSMILPAVLLTNLPLSSLIYWLLYRTRKYHIA